MAAAPAPDYLRYSGRAMRLDADSGKVIWKREYQYYDIDDTQHYLYGMALTQDGGMVACGMMVDGRTNTNDAWLVKTDSTGCDSVICKAPMSANAELRIKNVEFKVYPNPNNGNFQLDYNLPANTSAILRIIDITGRTVVKYELDNTSNTVNINETSLNSGLYCCQVLVNGAAVWQDKIVVK